MCLPYRSVNHYLKVLGIWCVLLTLDHTFSCRLELLGPVITLWRSMVYVFRVEGTVRQRVYEDLDVYRSQQLTTAEGSLPAEALIFLPL